MTPVVVVVVLFCLELVWQMNLSVVWLFYVMVMDRHFLCGFCCVTWLWISWLVPCDICNLSCSVRAGLMLTGLWDPVEAGDFLCGGGGMLVC